MDDAIKYSGRLGLGLTFIRAMKSETYYFELGFQYSSDISGDRQLLQGATHNWTVSKYLLCLVVTQTQGLGEAKAIYVRCWVAFPPHGSIF